MNTITFIALLVSLKYMCIHVFFMYTLEYIHYVLYVYELVVMRVVTCTCTLSLTSPHLLHVHVLCVCVCVLVLYL